MTHTSQSFAEHMLTLLKKSGDIGDIGDTKRKPFILNEKTVTASEHELSPIQKSGDSYPHVSGDNKVFLNQILTRHVTAVTAVTAFFEKCPSQRDRYSEWAKSYAFLEGIKRQDCVPFSRPGVPQEWVDGFGTLSREDPLPGFSEARWSLLLDDGLAFLNQWAAKAAEVGWTAGDVFGVHPTAPAARFDQMGVVPVITGGRVTDVEQDTATIISPGGSVLTYYRKLRSEGAYLWHRQNPQKGMAA